MVHVQNIFEIDVVFNEETVKESKKVSEQKVVLQVTSDSIVVAIEKSITKKKRKACLWTRTSSSTWLYSDDDM